MKWEVLFCFFVFIEFQIKVTKSKKEKHGQHKVYNTKIKCNVLDLKPYEIKKLRSHLWFFPTFIINGGSMFVK